MHRSSTQSGFTLIEMIVSLALFSVVVTIAVGALLVLIASNLQLQKEQSVMTNLSFALDSMTREIRTGTNYYCHTRNNSNAGPPNQRIFSDGQNLLSSIVRDCVNGKSPSTHRYHGVAFVEGGQSVTGVADTKIVYFYDADAQSLFRRVSGEDSQSIVSSGIVITDAEFFVTGSSEPLDGSNTSQPTVTIYIEAQDSDDPTGKTYQIQTTVTQRTLDL
jgi:prepilin-type N-terminal cleavage/methylation domain-containing protein